MENIYVFKISENDIENIYPIDYALDFKLKQ